MKIIGTTRQLNKKESDELDAYLGLKKERINEISDIVYQIIKEDGNRKQIIEKIADTFGKNQKELMIACEVHGYIRRSIVGQNKN